MCYFAVLVVVKPSVFPGASDFIEQQIEIETLVY